MKFKQGLSKHQKTTVMVMCIASFLAVLNQTILGPAIPAIGKDFEIDASIIQWTVTLYLLLSSIIVPINNVLMTNFSQKKLFNFSFVFYCIGSLMMAASPNYILFLCGRALQAISAGIITPASISVMMLCSEKEKRGSAIGVFGVITAIGPVIGPLLSGLFVDYLSWRYLFVIMSALFFVLLLIGLIYIPNRTIDKDTIHKIDLLSLVLCVIGLSLLLYVLGDAWKYENLFLLWGLIMLSVTTLILFVLRQVKIDNPLVDVGVFKTKQFSWAIVLTIIINGSGMCNAILIPVFIQDLLGGSAFDTALVTVPSTILALISNPIVGNLFDKYGPKGLAFMGTLVVALSSFGLAYFPEGGSLYVLSLVILLRNTAIIMVVRTLPTYGINSLNEKKIVTGNSVYLTLNGISGSIFTAIIVSLGYFVYNAISCNTEYQANIVANEFLAFKVMFLIQFFICIIMSILILIVINRKKLEE